MRCWNRGGGRCFNDEEKDLLADGLIEALKPLLGARTAEAKRLIMTRTKVRGLIEFSRSIHAEMHAILSAGMLGGARMMRGRLYVTTYPCHSCARHIVAAGISEVHYIEPYRKSLAVRLHSDSITESESDTRKVRILGYEGVAPSRYLSLFRSPEGGRKGSDGRLIRTVPRAAKPRVDKTLEALPTLEALVVEWLRKKRLVDGGDDEDDGSKSA
jgi:deoxycytidylate deaminase